MSKMTRRNDPADDTARRIERRILEDPLARRGYHTQKAIRWLGELVRVTREGRGENQEILAERAGMTQSELSRLENGLPSKGVTFATLLNLASALDLDIVFERHAAKRYRGLSWLKRRRTRSELETVPHLVERDLLKR